MITEAEFDALAEYAFSPANPGYKPAVREAPNGDGAWDEEKSYAHIAPKYFTEETPSFVREAYYEVAILASRVCRYLGLGPLPLPGPDSTLRLLRYPPGATTAPHTDFDLFTLSLYRSHPEAFAYLDGATEHSILADARVVSPGIHFGELMSEIIGVPATRHGTFPVPTPSKSAVFFVIPEHSFRLPSGMTVGSWIEERIARSRKEVAT